MSGQPITLALLCAFCTTAAALIVLRKLAPAMGLLDYPGGRKDHAQPTPVVGGIALMAGLLVCVTVLRLDALSLALVICSLAVFLAGLLDDMREISQYPRFAAQILACVAFLWLADTPLRSVGNLLGPGAIGLWIFAYPMTVFAVVGVVNAINMSDGLDGLAGGQGVVTAGAFALAAHGSGLSDLALLFAAVAAGLTAFLVFNLRHPWQPRATVFLGDAGSMTLGFLFGWAAVLLTQGADRSLPPICALWIVVIPLCDTVSLMLRRRAAGRSPFNPDREHLHHQLLARGFTVGQTTWLLILGGATTSAIGLGGWKLGVPEPILFVLFVALFISHHRISKAYWKRRGAPGPTTSQAPAHAE